jgi:molybdopterin converting factor small subunit
MATVWIPSLLRPLCGGAHTVEAGGADLGAVIDGLEARFPGVRERLLDRGHIRPELAIWVDGEQADGLAAAVEAASEIQIVPAIGGG